MQYCSNKTLVFIINRERHLHIDNCLLVLKITLVSYPSLLASYYDLHNSVLFLQATQFSRDRDSRESFIFRNRRGWRFFRKCSWSAREHQCETRGITGETGGVPEAAKGRKSSKAESWPASQWGEEVVSGLWQCFNPVLCSLFQKKFQKCNCYGIFLSCAFKWLGSFFNDASILVCT